MRQRVLFLIVGLAMLIVACDEDSTSVAYRVVSPTARPRVETTPVPTLDLMALTLEMSPTATPTPTEAPPTETSMPTATEEPSLAPSVEATDARASEEPTTETATIDADDVDDESTAEAPDGDEDTPTPETNNAELRQLQEDRDLLLRLNLDESCYLADTEITGRVVLTSFKETSFYFYERGQLLFSINNSPLAPDFPPPEPSVSDDFVLLEIEDTYEWEIEDLGLYIRGMGPEAGIDLGDTIFGLPAGDYWVTVAYSNDKNGLTQQRDGTYLIPSAAWRGIAVSREEHFTVVDDLADCTDN